MNTHTTDDWKGEHLIRSARRPQIETPTTPKPTKRCRDQERRERDAELIRALAAEGRTRAEIAKALKMNHQRVHLVSNWANILIPYAKGNWERRARTSK